MVLSFSPCAFTIIIFLCMCLKNRKSVKEIKTDLNSIITERAPHQKPWCLMSLMPLKKLLKNSSSQENSSGSLCGNKKTAFCDACVK